MSIEKVAQADALLTIAGEVDDLQHILAKYDHILEAQALGRVHDNILSELDLGDLHIAKPMSTSDRSKFKRQLKKHRPLNKKWMCCTKPTLQKVKGGTRVWVSTCRYKVMGGKHKGKVMAMKRIVGRNPKARPAKVMLKGQKIRQCA